jgi:hypothetical protein
VDVQACGGDPVGECGGAGLQKTMNLEILEADLNNPKHAEAVRQLVDK